MSRDARRPAAGVVPVVGLFLLTRATLFAVTTATDAPIYQRYAEAARADGLARLYHARAVEYPHLAVGLMAAAGAIADGLPDGVACSVNKRPVPENLPTPTDPAAAARYQVAFGLLVFLADAACLWLIGRIARRAYPDEPPAERAARLLRYVLFTTLAGLILFDRLDLVVGLFALVAVGALAAGRPRVGYAVLVLGGAFKLVPLLLLPVWVLAAAAVSASDGRFWRAVVREGLVAGLVLAAWPAVALPLAGGPGFAFLGYHADRGLEVAAPLAWPVALLDPTTAFGTGHGSVNLRGPLADRVAAGLGVLMAVAAGAGVGLSVRGFRRAVGTGITYPALVPHVVTSAALVWAGFIVCNKVGSPQYLLWLAPLVPLLPRAGGGRAADLLLVAAGLTALVYPMASIVVVGMPVDGEPGAWTGPSAVGLGLLAARTAALVGATAALAATVRRPPG